MTNDDVVPLEATQLRIALAGADGREGGGSRFGPRPLTAARHERDRLQSGGLRNRDRSGVDWRFGHVLAEDPGNRDAGEVETGKSDIKENLPKLQDKGLDRVVFVGTSPTADSACREVMDGTDRAERPPVELLTW